MRKKYRGLSVLLIITFIFQCYGISFAYSEQNNNKIKGIRFDSEKYIVQVGESKKIKLCAVYENQSVGQAVYDNEIKSTSSSGIEINTLSATTSGIDITTNGGIQSNPIVNTVVQTTELPTIGGIQVNPLESIGVMSNELVKAPTVGAIEPANNINPSIPDELNTSSNSSTPQSIKSGTSDKSTLTNQTDGSKDSNQQLINLDKVNLKSSNTKIVKLDKDGTLTGLSQGTATITAEYGDFIATAEVYVGQVSGLRLDSAVYTVVMGKTQNTAVKLFNKQIKDGLEYSIKDPSVATINQDGVIKAVGLGESVLIVKYHDLICTATVKVVNEIIMPPILSFSENNGTVTLTWTEPKKGAIYKVKRGTVPGLKLELASDLTSNTFTDSNIQKDMAYFYTVTAFKDGNESEESNMVIRTPAPSAPTLNALRLQNTIKLSWTYENGSDKFTLLKSDHQGGPYQTVLNKSNLNRYTDTNIEQGVTYYYIVTPYDNLEREGVTSKEKIVLPFDNSVQKFNPKGDDDNDQISNEDEVINGRDIKGKIDIDNINKKLVKSSQSVKDINNSKSQSNQKGKVPKKKKRNLKSKDGKINIDVYGDDSLDKAPLKVEDAKDAMFLKGVKGVIGTPVEISAGDTQINSAVITMKYDKKQLGKIPEDKLKIYWFDTENMKMVQLENVHVDKKNMVVTGETPHFSIYVLGADVEPNMKNIDMFIALDQSTGMKKQDIKNYRISLADSFIKSISDIYDKGSYSTTDTPEKFRIGLLEISNYTNIKAKLSNDYNALTSNLNNMKHTIGATNIADALLAANKQLTEVSKRKMMLLISNGQDTCGNSKTKILNLTDKLAAKQIVVNTVALGNNANFDLLKAIADRTGGSFFTFNLSVDAAQKEIDTAISQINEKLIKQIAFDSVTAVPSGVDMQQVAALYPDYYIGKDYDESNKLYDIKTSSNILTGNYINEATDIKIGYQGLPLAVERTYNSYEGSNKTILGNGWHLNYDSHLEVETWSSQTMIGIVTASALNVRVDAGINYKILGYISRNTRFNVLGTKKDSTNREWYQIGLKNGQKAYVASWYVKAAWLSSGGISCINVTYGSGTKVTFDLDESTKNSTIKKYITPFGCSDSLVQITDGYLLTRKDQTKYKYDNNGYLTDISDRYGNALSIVYNTDKTIKEVSDPLGRKLTFDYIQVNNFKLLQRVTESALNRYVEYMYDENCNLTGVLDLSGEKTSYEYTNKYYTSSVPEQTGAQIFDRSLLERIVDANGHQEVKNIYDPFDRLVKQYDGNNNVKYQMYKDIYRYEDSGTVIGDADQEFARYYIDENANESKEIYNLVTQKLITEVDAKGLKIQHRYWIDKGNKNYVEITGMTDEATYIPLVSGGRKATKEEIIDKKGFHTTYEYDENGNLTKVTDHYGKSINMEYSSTNDLTQKTDKSGTKSTVYNYITVSGGIYLDTVTDPYGNIQKYDYYKKGDDSGASGFDILLNGLVKRVSDNRKDKDNNTITGFKVTEYIYGDKYNNLTQSKDSYGNLTKEVHDSAGRLTQQTNARNYTTKYFYDNMDRLLVSEDPLNYKIINQYDNAGNIRFVTDKNKNITEYIYDAADQLIQTVNPKGYKIQYKYDAKGNKIEEINQKGGITQYDYDYLDRVIRTTDPLNNVTTYDYSTGNQTLICAPGNRQTIIFYDELYRKKQESRLYYGMWIITKYSYDPVDNLDTVTNDAGKVTKYYYDALNRVTKIVDGYGLPEADTTSYTYNVLTDSDVNYETVIEENALNQSTTKYYDALGRLIKITDARNNSTTYTYDEAGNLKTEKDARKNSPKYEYDKTKYSAVYDYDALNRVIKITDPLGKFVKKEYDHNGNIVCLTDKKGNKTQNIYNNLNQLVETIDPMAHSTKYTYDELGNKASVTDAVGNRTVYDYNVAGQLISETDGMGHKQYYRYDDAGNKSWVSTRRNEYIGTKYIYDQLNRLERVIDPEGMGTVYTYDTVDNVLTKTVGDSKTSYQYDSLNRVKKAVFSGDATIPANVVNYEYDAIGQLKQTDNSMGITDTYDYDENGNLTVHTKTKGLQKIIISIVYDEIGNKLTEKDANGTVTTYGYDELNRLKVSSVDVSGVTHTTAYGYDANDNQTIVTDWRGNTITRVYDDSNRLIEKIDAYGKTEQKLEYYDNDIQHYSYDALNNKTEFTYDRDKRLLSTKDPEEHIVSQEYDEDDNIISKTDGAGNTLYYTYDYNNRLKSVWNLMGEISGYTYDINGNLLKQKDGRGNVITYEYNSANKAIKRIDNGGAGNPAKTETYTYYPDGSLAVKTDRNGTKIIYDYDVHGLISSETTDSGEKLVSFTYDGNGNQRTMTDKTGVTIRTFDELNRVTTKNVPDIGTITYTYDITDGMEDGCTAERSKDPNNNITLKVYDKVGRLKEVTADGKTTTYNYYDNSNRQSVVYPDGSKEEYTYYADGLVKALYNYKKAEDQYTKIDGYSYLYDGAHNLTNKTDNKGVTAYTYDELNRLHTVTEPGGKETTYDYDLAGNREQETIKLHDAADTTTVTTYNRDDCNRLRGTFTYVNWQITETENYTYDNNGNQLMTTKTVYSEGNQVSQEVPVNNTYDKQNQLVSTTLPNNQTVTCTYNGEGLRVSRIAGGVLTRYLYDYDQVILELYDNGNQARNVYGTNLLTRTAGSDTYYYMYNGHGDVTALLKPDGTVAATYYYDAFGVPDLAGTTGNVNNPYTYSGYQYDKETGTYYCNARMYDPKTARFLQEDTYLGDPNDPLSLNLYTYCSNNPIVYYDPTGHGQYYSGYGEDYVNAQIQKQIDQYYQQGMEQYYQNINSEMDDYYEGIAVSKSSDPQVKFNYSLKQANKSYDKYIADTVNYYEKNQYDIAEKMVGNQLGYKVHALRPWEHIREPNYKAAMNLVLGFLAVLAPEYAPVLFAAEAFCEKDYLGAGFNLALGMISPLSKLGFIRKLDYTTELSYASKAIVADDLVISNYFNKYDKLTNLFAQRDFSIVQSGEKSLLKVIESNSYKLSKPVAGDNIGVNLRVSGVDEAKVGSKVFTNSVEYVAENGTGITYKVFQRNDIDWNMVRNTGARKGRGLTNEEAASKYGLAPILDDAGNVATLHHSQQRSVGPLFEASTRYHNISNAKKAPLHPYKGKLNPDYPMNEATRELFQKEDSIEYWKWRGTNAMEGLR